MQDPSMSVFLIALSERSLPATGRNFPGLVCVCVSFYYTPFSAKPEESPIYYRKFVVSSTQLDCKQCPFGTPIGEKKIWTDVLRKGKGGWNAAEGG